MGNDSIQTGVNELPPGAARDLSTAAAEPTDFWTIFFRDVVQQTGAVRIALMERGAGGHWEARQSWPDSVPILPEKPGTQTEIEALAAEAADTGIALRRYPAGGTWLHLAAVGAADGASLVMLRLEGVGNEEALAATARAAALAARPELHKLRRLASDEKYLRTRMADVLDLTLRLEEAETFLAAAMLLCNELSGRLGCDRVSLGWVRGRYARLRAVSHGEQFQKNTGIVQAVELAMEEALDQDDEVLWPPDAGSTHVARAHAAFATREQVQAMATFPLRAGPRITGALCLERSRPFTDAELTELRLIADHVTARLETLELRSRWFGERWLQALRRSAGKLIGHEHTGAKLLAAGIAAVIAALAVIHVTYRVQAPFHLECEKLAQLPAPFDGFIEEVHFRSGDFVHGGDLLVSLDKRELFQQEAAATADVHQHQVEAEMAESDQKVADMRIALAAAAESRASLDLARLRIEEADIRAPFDGYVVEGDLRERLAAPVKQGEVLLKVARVNAIYPSVDIGERDVQLIRAGAPGEVAFASQPDTKFAIRIQRVQPVAETTPDGNIFVADAQFTGSAADWWRPGMSGVAKIDTGPRSLLWIITHRTVDFLRLKLWW
ncbi:MAG TPA: efflux RND transporter periplasmic adaptor subunit [Chthoniobacteraceae bacterium]|jgi:hypothetical protein|nr:efflux RND transporter periplasmic adaptor subunit [Chthoniobacteraceae bacterium]